jgi:putative isomerase
MQLYDVGMTSMFTMESAALAELADAIGRSEAAMLRQRAASMQARISAHLWDEQGQIFTNMFVNESFYRRISPTSFYPLLANASTDAQATLMIERWLMNRSRFCITPTGDMVGNNPAGCYWGLPSISADDDAFKGNGNHGYWRGHVWGPMLQLTFWGLQNYDHVQVVRTARKALAQQSTAMMMEQWDAHAHICENFSPTRGTPDCSGDSFYSWGALAGMVSLLEGGYW